jgi:hypothetical protein
LKAVTPRAETITNVSRSISKTRSRYTEWRLRLEAFESARRQWEYSHAVNAVLTFAAFVFVILSVLSHKRDAS